MKIDNVKICHEYSVTYLQLVHDDKDVNVANISTSKHFVSKNNTQIWYKNEVIGKRGRHSKINILCKKQDL